MIFGSSILYNLHKPLAGSNNLCKPLTGNSILKHRITCWDCNWMKSLSLKGESEAETSNDLFTRGNKNLTLYFSLYTSLPHSISPLYNLSLLEVFFGPQNPNYIRLQTRQKVFDHNL
ncbi:hypothetical protein L6452_39962 [Arctium lappa]|uniref:Uncharacterized protein n=1 Tax=Arctium lappa TaxID=4217 RepID=A0ACB8XVF4_ARCLA|nr:hypothetical protein L6452_39962 [Arctium lappa]